MRSESIESSRNSKNNNNYNYNYNNNNNNLFLNDEKNGLLASTTTTTSSTSFSSPSSPFDNNGGGDTTEDLSTGQLESQREGKENRETLRDRDRGDRDRGGEGKEEGRERKAETVLENRGTLGEGDRRGGGEEEGGDGDELAESVGEGNLISYIRMTAFDRTGSKVLVDILDDQVRFTELSNSCGKSYKMVSDPFIFRCIYLMKIRMSNSSD